MSPVRAIQFQSITLTEQRVRGEPDDHALSTIRLDLEYTDGHVDHDVPIVVWHALGPMSGGIVRLIVRKALQDIVQPSEVSRCIEQYYRRHVAVEQERLRFSEPCHVATVTGIQLSTPEHVALEPTSLAVA